MLIKNKWNHVFVNSSKVAGNLWNLEEKNPKNQDEPILEKKSGTEFVLIYALISRFFVLETSRALNLVLVT